MSGLLWMPKYIEAWNNGTHSMTWEEKGLYDFLLMQIFEKQRPLPDDDAKLAKLCRMTARRFARVVKPIIEEKFFRTEGGWMNKRVEIELAKAQEHLKKSSEGGRKSAERKSLKKKDEVSTPLDVRLPPKPDPLPLPSQADLEKEERKEDSSPPPPLAAPAPVASVSVERVAAKEQVSVPAVRLKNDPEFEAFWRRYPRKVGIGAARVAYAKARRKADHDAIMEGLERTRWSADPQYNPHPATWLNQERWVVEDDEVAPIGLKLREPVYKRTWADVEIERREREYGGYGGGELIGAD